MAETEKITVNLSIVDLGKIDLLVDEGFYSNRTDFIRTGIRNLFISHADSLQQSIKRHFAVVGTLIIGPRDLERAFSKNEKRSYSVIGMLWIKNDVSPDLAGEAPPSPLVVSDEMSSLVGMSLREIERWAIEQTLKISNGNREETAQILGISERNLYRKLKEFELR